MLTYALKTHPIDDNGRDDVNDWHVMTNQRKEACLLFVTDHLANLQVLGVALVCTIPMDKLSNRLQHLDASSSALLELTLDSKGPKNPFHACQEHLWQVSNPFYESRRSQHLSVLWDHLAAAGCCRETLVNDARKAATTLASQVWARCEVRFQSWPYRLLAWPMLDKAGRDQLQEVFWNADACCLDSWFSSPLRSAMTSADQFGNPEFISLLETLVQRVRTTNMALEGFLNEIKNSAPAGRGQKPSMERLSYLGFLKTLMKQHLKAGHRDFWMCMGRDELAARGVPVEGKARVVYKARRPDMKWQVGMLDQWNPRWRSDVVPGALQTKSAELAERWRGMSDQERAPWLDQEASEGEDSEVDDSAANDFFKGMGLEFPGDSNWPVRSEVLSSFLEGEVAESNVCAGVANKMARIRFAAQDKLFIKDAGLVPDGKTFLHRLSCSERHPGLCFVSDHWLYQDCLMMVKSLENFLNIGCSAQVYHDRWLQGGPWQTKRY